MNMNKNGVFLDLPEGQYEPPPLPMTTTSSVGSNNNNNDDEMRNSSRSGPPFALRKSRTGSGSHGARSIHSTFSNSARTLDDLWSDTGSDIMDDFEQSAGSKERNDIKKQSLKLMRTTRRTKLVALMLVIGGLIASTSFLYLGIKRGREYQVEHFNHDAMMLTMEIGSTWDDYERSALWIHESCRDWRTNATQSRRDFEALYHYLTSGGGGLEFYAAEWVPNVTHAERPLVEAEGATGWGVSDYQGFMGHEPDPANPDELIVAPRSDQPYYFPLHFGEPKEKLLEEAHFDLFSDSSNRPYLERALNTWEPAVTPRVIVAEEDGYSVMLYHPGVPLPASFQQSGAKDLASMTIHVQSILMRGARFQPDSLAVYLYDSTLHDVDNEMEHEFLGGVLVNVTLNDHDEFVDKSLDVLDETDLLEVEEAAYLYYEHEVEVGGRIWTVVVVPVDGTYKPELNTVIVTGGLIFVVCVFLAMWMYSNVQKSIEKHKVIAKAAAESLIVSNLFPPDVKARMIQDALANQRLGIRPMKNVYVDALADGFGDTKILTSEGIFGTRPIAELHPYTTVMQADIAGFTGWASVREPSQVFQLLEIVYHSFDTIAKRRRVYKVETRGDSYICVAGLPQPRSDHAVVMSRFAANCISQMHRLCKALERTLGYGTADLGLRVGLHSGQVVAGVLRGDKGRFQLFGDTVNQTARMEATGARNKVHISQETANLLRESGRGDWLLARDEKVSFAGKGSLQTYFLKSDFSSRAKEQIENGSCHSSRVLNLDDADSSDSNKTERLVEWLVEVLSGLLRRIVARRKAVHGKVRKGTNTCVTPAVRKGEDGMVLDEVAEIITMPSLNECAIRKQVDPDSITLDSEIVGQLQCLITKIASMYRDNPFHCLEHASHVTMSVIKMMGRIVDPKEIAIKRNHGEFNSQQLEAELHDHTFGITSDPLTQFACAFSALIHDLDHMGIPNSILIQEGSPLAAKYQNKSVAEQNSVDLAWDLLMSPDYDKLRACICCNDEEFTRFRSLVVNSVMATDIMDKELGAARKARWNKAFSDDGANEEDEQCAKNRKATIVIEHLIQASDISHTMQHWHVYIKWNERLFQEMYKAYKAGRLDKDPSVGWHKGEIGFFDFYIIPLAKKLFTCGVFGVSSDEFLNYAMQNRHEWEQKGADMVKLYLKNYEEKFEESGADKGDLSSEDDNSLSRTTGTADMTADTVPTGHVTPRPRDTPIDADETKKDLKETAVREVEPVEVEVRLNDSHRLEEGQANVEVTLNSTPPPPMSDVFLDEISEAAGSLAEQSLLGEGPEAENPPTPGTHHLTQEDEGGSKDDGSFLTARSSFQSPV